MHLILARQVHRMKEREWNVEALASKLRRQAAWESTKRAIVLDSVRTGVLEKRMLASAATQEGRKGGGWGGGGVTSRTTDAEVATASLSCPPRAKEQSLEMNHKVVQQHRTSSGRTTLHL